MTELAKRIMMDLIRVLVGWASLSLSRASTSSRGLAVPAVQVVAKSIAIGYIPFVTDEIRQGGSNVAKKKKSITPQQAKLSESQQAWLDAWNAPVDRKALEAEYRELVRLGKQGKLIPMEQVLRELYPRGKRGKKKPA